MNSELVWSAARGDSDDSRFCVFILQLQAASIITRQEARELLQLDDE